jgi:uncharacterized protein YciI
MMYAVLFEDDATRSDVRPKYMSDHLAFLERNASGIHAAGPLKDSKNDAPAGGLWIVEAGSPEAVLALNEAFVGYNGYLEVLPDDADVRIERARTHQMRRNYDLAITDLERAAELKPERAQALKDQVSQLRLLLARTPK